MDILLVGIGGALGSISRYLLGKSVAQKSKTVFPFGTFIINISGSILLGVVMGFNVGNTLYILLAEGFLGAYTTFSTFMYEGFNLFQDNEKMNAFVYVISTILLGLGGFVLGFELGKVIRLIL